MTTNKVISGAFDSTLKARAAIADLHKLRVRPEAISVLLPEGQRDDFARIDDSTKAPEGAALGGAAGVALGALAAGLTAVATVVVPGVGILAAGPIVAALAGAGAGGAVGGAVGGLIGLGIPEHEAKFHTDILKNGGTVLVVSTDNKEEQKAAQEVFAQLAVKSETTKGHTAHVHPA